MQIRFDNGKRQKGMLKNQVRWAGFLQKNSCIYRKNVNFAHLNNRSFSLLHTWWVQCCGFKTELSNSVQFQHATRSIWTTANSSLCGSGCGASGICSPARRPNTVCCSLRSWWNSHKMTSIGFFAHSFFLSLNWTPDFESCTATQQQKAAHGLCFADTTLLLDEKKLKLPFPAISEWIADRSCDTLQQLEFCTFVPY